jgi:hypothetical protein
MQYATPIKQTAVMVAFLLLLHSIRGKQLLIYRHLVDALLGKLKRGKENSIYDARARHGNAEAAVHARVHELDLGSRGFVAAADEAVALVDAFCRVNGEDLGMSVRVRPWL